MEHDAGARPDLLSVAGQVEAENETYVNFDEATLIEKRDFMGRTFLITGPRITSYNVCYTKLLRVLIPLLE